VIVVDTSVAVPWLASWHEHHGVATKALARDEPRLIAHVALEMFSVLTRLPDRRAVAPADAHALIEAGFSGSLLTLPADRHRRLLRALAEAGIGGGAVYDGLVGATAAHAGAVLYTFDRRALPVYGLVGAEVELLS
jgi:predicted nucleic acid-binding protein